MSRVADLSHELESNMGVFKMNKNECYEVPQIPGTLVTNLRQHCPESYTVSKQLPETVNVGKQGYLLCAMFVLLTVFVALLCATIVYSYLQIHVVKSEMASFRQTTEYSRLFDSKSNKYLNLSSLLSEIASEKLSLRLLSSKLSAHQNSSDTMLHLLNTLNNSVKQLNTTQSKLKAKTELLDNATQELVDFLGMRGQYAASPIPSCAALLALVPSSPSGNYWVMSSTGSAVLVYCDMTRSCGNITGGWMRVAELDMSDNNTQCPDDLLLRESPKRTCTAMNTYTGPCSSVEFSVSAVRYSRLCGRIKAYQVGTPDAFGSTNSEGRGVSIDSNYVDGVSLTHGAPRQHIWTFAAALDEGNDNLYYKCPCINSDLTVLQGPPAFVGNDYFCDTGSQSGLSASEFHADDPLWDGAGCGPRNTCCSFNNPPWFYKQLPRPTTDDIEMRLCRDQYRHDEDIAIEVVEIYVQ